FFLSLIWRHPRLTLFPYTTLFRSNADAIARAPVHGRKFHPQRQGIGSGLGERRGQLACEAAKRAFDEHALQPLAHVHGRDVRSRSEEHTSELQSRSDLVCRLLLEK